MQNLILNRYRPIATAGKGGYASVYVAWDTRIQRRVAIKCLPLANSAIDPATGEFTVPGLAEARTAAMLSDPTIVGVLDFEIEGDMAYLIMEYVDGVTLTQLMRKEGPLPLDVVACVFDAVAHALDSAHDNMVLHLDIKPDNVLINRQGQVKVSDFGLAQLAAEAGYGSAEGGTIGYMPLEQMKLEALDERTDEWALAALTYQMLTGDNPFYADDLEGAEKAIQEAEIIIPSQARNDVDGELDDALFRALTIEREGRYDSVEEFAEALLPLLGDPARGKRQLQVIVGEARDDGVAAFEDDGAGNTMPVKGITRVDRMSGRKRSWVYRLWTAVASGFVGAVALHNVPQLQDLPAVIDNENIALLVAVVGVMALVGAIVPAGGALLAVLALGAAFIARQSYALGAAILVFGLVWWWFSGRKGHAQAACGITMPLLGAVGLAPACALVNAYFLRWRDALGTTAYAVVLAVALACVGSLSLAGWDIFEHFTFPTKMEVSLVPLAKDPATWVMMASWLVAAPLAAACCGHGSRWAAFLGMLLASAVLIGALCGGTYLSTGHETWLPKLSLLIPTAVGCGVMTLATLAGVPVKSRE